MRIPKISELTPASTWPVTVSMAKAQIRYDESYTQEDAYLTKLIAGVCSEFERRSSFLIRPRNVIEFWPAFEPYLNLYHFPVTEITEVSYKLAGSYTLFTTSNYEYDFDIDPAFIVPKYGYQWPSHDTTAQAVKVEYKAGYATCPDDFINIILAIIGKQHFTREDEQVRFDTWADRIIHSLRRYPV